MQPPISDAALFLKMLVRCPTVLQADVSLPLNVRSEIEVERDVDLINGKQQPFYFEKENFKKVVDFEPKKPIKSDVQEIKHAKWEEIRDAYGQLEGWIHIECGREVKIKENYCPSCGARMDKE